MPTDYILFLNPPTRQTIRHHIHHPPPIAPDLPNRPPTSSWDTLQYTFTPRPSPEQPPNPPPSLQSPSPSARPTSPPAHSSFHTSLNRPTPSPGSVIGGTFEESDKDARAGPRGSPLAIVHRSEDSRLDLSVECRKVLDLSWEREGQGGSRKGLFPLSSKEGNEPSLCAFSLSFSTLILTSRTFSKSSRSIRTSFGYQLRLYPSSHQLSNVPRPGSNVRSNSIRGTVPPPTLSIRLLPRHHLRFLFTPRLGGHRGYEYPG